MGFSLMDDRELAQVAKRVDEFHRESVHPPWAAADGIASYVMDVEYVMIDGTDEWQIRLIELNSFGAELASGSALFHWVRDASDLYSSDRLCIRTRLVE